MTGLITLLGWAGHEAGWRSGIASVDTICSDIQMMYENPGFTLHLMEKYGVTYLFVGEVEQEKYRVSLAAAGLEQVFAEGECAIYKSA